MWNRFSAPVDQDTVKAEFFRKVHSKNPPFRFKLRSTAKERIQIPPMVEYHYQNPPSLLPTLRDVLRCEVVHKKGQSHELIHEDLNKMIEDDLKAIQEANRISDELDDNKDGILVSEDTVVNSSIEMDDSMDKKDIKIQKAQHNKHLEIKKEDAIDTTTEIMSSVDEELKCLDISLIKLLAFQRLQQILEDNPDIVGKYQHESTAIAIRDALCRNPPKRNMPLPSQLLTKEDIERIAREFTSPQKDGSISIGGTAVVATTPCDDSIDTQNRSNPIQYFDDIERKRIKLDEMYYAANGFDEFRSDEEKAIEIAARLENPIKHSKIRARAVVIPVSDILSGKR